MNTSLLSAFVLRQYPKLLTQANISTATPILSEEGQIKLVLKRVGKFVDQRQRLPRFLLSTVTNQYEKYMIESLFAKFGFAVNSGPPLETPENLAQCAFQTQADAVTVCGFDEEHVHLFERLSNELRKLHKSNIAVLAGGVIDQFHRSVLIHSGVDVIFNPRGCLLLCAQKALDKIESNTDSALSAYESRSNANDRNTRTKPAEMQKHRMVVHA
ncbi:hypothetical protein AB6A40_001895 [Gnathostoma spinigerum]|uniref:B12-binding domain-containing protein n=1 Tax=Gnathostoma spinigerum TaxID=75299 RepID=A0ABD6E6I6_9BILA